MLTSKLSLLSQALIMTLVSVCVFAFAIPKVTAQSNAVDLSTDQLLSATDPAAVATESSGSSLSLPTATPTLDQTFERQRQLEQLYQALIEAYGNAAREFSLNQAQWRSLQTLRSLEEAVIATNAVLIARDKTMITYFELLLEVLSKTPGIEVTLKQQSQEVITKRIEWLRQHELQTTSAHDRDSVNARSDDYSAQSEVFLAEARQALMLIRLGRLQTTFDRTNGLYDRIISRNEANVGTSIQEVERKRAYTQVDVLRNEIQWELRRARESLSPTTAERGRVETDYNRLISSLEDPYGKTSKYLSFLEELARDTW